MWQRFLPSFRQPHETTSLSTTGVCSSQEMMHAVTLAILAERLLKTKHFASASCTASLVLKALTTRPEHADPLAYRMLWVKVLGALATGQEHTALALMEAALLATPSSKKQAARAFQTRIIAMVQRRQIAKHASFTVLSLPAMSVTV